MQIFGSNKKNKLFGELEADRMCGLDGDDELKGKDGNDELWGNAGADELWGEAGNDSVYGGKGSDFLVVDEETVAEPVEESPEESSLPAPLPRGKRPNPITPENKYICIACGKGFPFRSKLEQHAHQSHPQSVVHILSQYPKT